MKLHGSAFIRTFLTLALGAGALQAAGEAYLVNDTGQRLVIRRSPSPGPVATHCGGELRASVLGVSGTARNLTASFHPGSDACLALEPGATAELGWEVAPLEGTRAHLGIQVGGAERNGYLEYQAPHGSSPWASLGAYEFSGRQLDLYVTWERDRPLCVLRGFQHLAEPAVPDQAASPAVNTDPDLEEPLVPAPFAGAAPTAPPTRTRRLDPRTLGKLRAPVQAHHLTYLANTSENDVVLTLPSQGQLEPGPSVLAQLSAQDQAVDPGAWAPLAETSGLAGPAGQPRLRISPGQVAVIGLDRSVAPGHRTFFSLAMEERKETCMLQLLVSDKGDPTLGPLGVQDRVVLDNDHEDTDTLLVDHECFNRR